MKLKDFYGKSVLIKADNGNIFVGTIDEYFFPEDNENNAESIVLKTNCNELIEFFENNISEITKIR